MLKAIEDELDGIKLQGQEGLTKPALFLFELLNKCGMNFNKRGYIFDIISRLMGYFGAQTPNPRHHNGASLGKFMDFLQTVFTDNMSSISIDSSSNSVDDEENRKRMRKMSSYYKVHVKSDAIRGRLLCYWCLCPGYSMIDLLAEGARCIILTSGTLSPISTFKDDMKIPLEIVLENPHIIKETQINVMALAKGPNNVVLSSKYTNRDSESYLQALGQLIINFCKVVPHGVLVFFPSYKLLETTSDYWRRNNQWKQIGDAKSIFIESKGAKECSETVAKYYERIKDKKYNGAIFFAVCRGKVSEGIDFADNNGRAVIVTGLPYPLYNDPRVMLKRQYLDENKPSSGTLWYNQQTYRAVNQAIGRVIRHRLDYGAIILCDERFTQQSSISQLPSWMRMHLKKINDPASAITELGKFFNVAIKYFPIILPKIPNLQSNSVSYVNTDASGNRNQTKNKLEDVNNIYASYGVKTDDCGVSSEMCCKNKSGLDALENFNGDDSTTPKFAGAFCSTASQENESSENNQSNFKLILQKRKNEEAAKNQQKCKVVIRASQEINEVAKSSSITDSKSLLEKITKKLNKEDYLNFKVALSSFYQAKKANDIEKKLKYYKILRGLFLNDLEFFSEIESFIKFTGVIKNSSSFSVASSSKVLDSMQNGSTKRKFDECDNDK